METSSATWNGAASRRSPRAGAFLLLFLSATAGAAAAPLDQALSPAVRAAGRIAPRLGVHVLDLESGETVYALEPDLPRVVASNTKLFTTAAALDALGPGFFFETEVLVRGYLIGDALVGDLGVVGGGDPAISGRRYDGDPLAVFRGWAALLGRLGIAEVEGDLYLANGRFESLKVHPDWPRDQLGRRYEAPVDALSFSDNCLLVRVRPGSTPGRPARVETVPDLPLLAIRNLARTTSSVRNHRVGIARRDGSDEVRIWGWIYRHSRPVESWVTVPEPAAYFGAALRKALADEGVEVRGEIRPLDGLPEGGWVPLTVHRTDLLTVLEVTNRNSQNFFAESLLKTLGAELCGEGSWSAGRRAVAEFLERIGIREGSYSLADGSGMSRNNRFTPRQLTRLLAHMYRHPLGAEFVATLPTGGDDVGRWDKRLAEAPYRGNVRAKTGTLRAISTLSGYARAASGRVYAFAILCNDVGSVWDARRAQDRIVRALVDHG